MRFVECCIATTLVATPVARGVAQSAAPVPAAVARRAELVASRFSPDSNGTSLRVHMLRGGGIGGLVGLGLTGALLIIANTENECYTAPSSVPGLGSGCSENLSFSKGSAILIGGAAAGAVVGSFLGYMYHVNKNEERARRCRANPSGCP